MDITDSISNALIADTKSDKLIKAVLGTIAGFMAKQVVEDGYDKFIKNRRNH